jgi:glycosyltransferase involved in cell wall biosynthesis
MTIRRLSRLGIRSKGHKVGLSPGRAPRVTIGLPVYNGEPFLVSTLESLLAQTFTDFEIVVCDNASTDGTAAIVQEYAAQDGRIRYDRNARNMGAVYNYNRTLALARGEYFKWSAADDVIRPEFLAQCVAALEADPALVMAYSRAAFIDEADRVIYRFEDVVQLKPWPKKVIPRAEQALAALFRDGSAAHVLIFGLCRTDALRAMRPLGNYFGCDWPAVTELVLSGEIYEIPQVLSFYRRHQGSSSTYRRSPSAKAQQQFYDPSVSGRLRQEFQLRRRYLEVFRSIARANLPPAQRVRIAMAAIYSILRRALWRAGYELRSALGYPDEFRPAPVDGIGRHWMEFQRRWVMDDGPWTMDHGPWTMGDG